MMHILKIFKWITFFGIFADFIQKVLFYLLLLIIATDIFIIID